MQNIFRTVALLVVAFMATAQVQAFVVHPQQQRQQQQKISAFSLNNNAFAASPSQVLVKNARGSSSSSSSSSSLSMAVDDGIGRGIPIFAVILLACVWCFTIPTEFRRAYICSERCAEEQNRLAPQCNSCITGEEWSNGIKEYYANGGGIQWDFSIDPKSKMKFN